MGPIFTGMFKANAGPTPSQPPNDRFFRSEHPIVSQFLGPPPKKVSGDPPKPLTSDDIRQAAKNGDWSSVAHSIVESTRMTGTAGTHGGPVSLTIQQTDAEPESTDPAAHLKIALCIQESEACASLAAKLLQSPFSLSSGARAALSKAASLAMEEPNKLALAKSAKSESPAVEALNKQWRENRIEKDEYVRRLKALFA